jgi:DNA polymerase III delta prime subunit
MFQSIIISGSDPTTRLEKALSLLPFEIPKDWKDCLISDGITKHPDIYYITTDTSIGIKEIRELENKISLRPAVSSHKVIIIKDAEKLTTEAQNALLKTLEEPPDYVSILLLTKEADLLLPTIICRCRIINLSFKPQIIIEKDFEEQAKLFNQLLNSRVGERLEKTAELAKTREDAFLFIEQSLSFWHQLLLNKYNNSELTSSQIISILKATQQAQSLLQKNINPRLVLDNLLMIY